MSTINIFDGMKHWFKQRCKRVTLRVKRQVDTNMPMPDDLKQQALEYHEKPIPGKLSVAITKPTETQGL